MNSATEISLKKFDERIFEILNFQFQTNLLKEFVNDHIKT